MKTHKKYTKLTIESALKLLQENNWTVENCIFSDYPNFGVTGTLNGIVAGSFIKEPAQDWEHCWKIEEETIWEVGDQVMHPTFGECEVKQVGINGVLVKVKDEIDLSVCIDPRNLQPASISEDTSLDSPAQPKIRFFTHVNSFSDDTDCMITVGDKVFTAQSADCHSVEDCELFVRQGFWKEVQPEEV